MNGFRVLFAVLLATCAVDALAVEFRSGWEYRAFFQEVALCKAAVVMPGAAKYEASGLKAGVPREQLRNETISMLPAFELYASVLCYCAVGEVAKNRTLGEYRGKDNDLATRMGLIKEQSNSQACQAEAAAVAQSLDKEGRPAPPPP